MANVKRRVASLPSITCEEHEGQRRPSQPKRTPKSSSPHDHSEDEKDEGDESDTSSDDSNISAKETDLDPAKCLFCLQESSTIGLNISHMETCHGFRIPEIDKLQEGLDPLLWYLDLVINRFFSCLHCGHSKHSAEAARAHMLATGHCMLDMSPGSEYLEFWETSQEPGESNNSINEDAHKLDGGPRMLSTKEMSLSSGRVVFSRKSDVRVQRRNPTAKRDDLPLVRRDLTDEPVSEPEQQDVTKEIQHISKRDQMGIVGLSNAERRLILATQKRMKSQQARKWSARHWTEENLSTSIKRTVFKQNLAGG